MKKVLILGVGGSIGTSALDIIRKHQDHFKLCGASTYKNRQALSQVKKEFNIDCLHLSSEEKGGCFSYYGTKGLIPFIEKARPDIVINAIAGSAGLAPSVAVLERGIDLALANKETIVMAGDAIEKLAQQKNAHILPVDSEHAALFELSQSYQPHEIKYLWLTASGGPFLNRPLDSFNTITKEQTLAHPTWSMGQKISVDSATMANKGLELIEAAYLFHRRADEIKIVIHPTSQVHSLIETIEGSFYAQLSEPDMKLPILNALCWPDKIQSQTGRLNLFDLKLEFKKPDEKRFPMLTLAREAVTIGESAPLTYNAANEAAVDSFLKDEIHYTQINQIVSQQLNNSSFCNLKEFSEILELNSTLFKETKQLIHKHFSNK